MLTTFLLELCLRKILLDKTDSDSKGLRRSYLSIGN